MFSLKLPFQYITFPAFRLEAFADVMTFKKTRWGRGRIRQLISMSTVNLSVVSKLIFAFPSENICVGAK